MIAKYLGGEKENKKNLTEKLTKIAKGKDVGLATEAQVKAAKKAAHDSSVSGSIGNAMDSTFDFFSGNKAKAKKEEEKKAEEARKKEAKRKADNLKARKAREEKKAKEEAAKKTAKTPVVPVKD